MTTSSSDVPVIPPEKTQEEIFKDLQIVNLDYYNSLVMFRQCCEDALDELEKNNIIRAKYWLKRALQYDKRKP